MPYFLHAIKSSGPKPGAMCTKPVPSSFVTKLANIILLTLLIHGCVYNEFSISEPLN
jgi:hypothetical protein